MNEPYWMYTGLSQAAWGYFFITLDVNFNGVSILPRFVGYILLYLAINKLSKARRDLNLLRPLAVVLICWHFMSWVLSWRGGSAAGPVLFLSLTVGVTTLYFHFQFLTDMAALAEIYQPEGDNLAAEIRSHRTAFTLLLTAVTLLASAAEAFPWQGWSGITVVAAVLGFILSLMIMADLFHLRRLVPRGETEEQ